MVTGELSEGVATTVASTVAVCTSVTASVTVLVAAGTADETGVVLPPSTATTEYDGACGTLFGRMFFGDQLRGNAELQSSKRVAAMMNCQFVDLIVVDALARVVSESLKVVFSMNQR